MRKCVQAEQSEKPAKRFGLLKKIDIISLKEFFSYYDIRWKSASIGVEKKSPTHSFLVMSEFGLVRFVDIYRRFQHIVSNKHEP